MKIKKSTSTKKKRKSQDSTDQQPPAKKQKNLHVVIPSVAKEDITGLVSPRKPRSPSTPRHLRENENLRQRVLSPLARARRPIPSPLSKDFKARTPTKAGGFVPGSPKTPFFSPLTPKIVETSNLRSVVAASDECSFEIQESDHEKENVMEDEDSREISIEDAISATPTKARYENKIEHLLNPRQENSPRKLAPPPHSFTRQVNTYLTRGLSLAGRMMKSPR